MSDIDVHEPESTPAESPRWWQRSEVKRIALIWLILTIVMECFAWVPAWLMGPSASQQMDDIKSTMTLFTVMAVPVAAVIGAIALYSIAKWRYKGDEPPPDDAPGFNNNQPTVVVWVLVSAVLTLIVFIWGLMKIASVPGAGGLAAVAADSAKPVEVMVTGQQWAWNFTYPAYGGIQSDVLYLPLERPTNFEVNSKDVIHSFWVVELGIKVDANPGAITETAVQPTVAGTYVVRCAELCGVNHAAMQTSVRVVTMAEFEAWVKEKQAEKPVDPPLPEPEEGA